MTQKLTVFRFGKGWAVRDVTGTIYAQSSDIQETIAEGERMAVRFGGTLSMSGEAEVTLRNLQDKRPA